MTCACTEEMRAEEELSVKAAQEERRVKAAREAQARREPPVTVASPASPASPAVAE